MNTPNSFRTRITTILTATVIAICINGCVALPARQVEQDTALVSAIELHGGKIEYHSGMAVQNARIKAISLPASALEKINPMAFQVFPRLRVVHLRDIPAGAEGETYETACCVNGKEELAKLVAEYRKAKLMR